MDLNNIKIEDLLEEIELFMTKVLPELEVPDYATAAE